MLCRTSIQAILPWYTYDAPRGGCILQQSMLCTVHELLGSNHLDVWITSSDFSLLSLFTGLYSTCVVGAWVHWSGNRHRKFYGCRLHWGHWCQYEEPCVTWMMSCGMLSFGIFTGWNWCFQVPWRFWHSWALNFLVCSMDIQLLRLLNFYLSRWPRGYVLEKNALSEAVLKGQKTFRSELLVDFGHDPDLQANIRQACKCLVKWMLWITLCMSARGLLECPSHKDASLCVSWWCKVVTKRLNTCKLFGNSIPLQGRHEQYMAIKSSKGKTWLSFTPSKFHFHLTFWPRYGLAAIFYFYLSMEDTSPGMSLSCTTAPNSAAGCCDASPWGESPGPLSKTRVFWRTRRSNVSVTSLAPCREPLMEGRGMPFRMCGSGGRGGSGGSGGRG